MNRTKQALSLNFERVMKGERSYAGFARNMMQKHGLTQREYQNLAPAAARHAKARSAKSLPKPVARKGSALATLKAALVVALLASKGAVAPIVSDLYNNPARRRNVHTQPMRLYQDNNNFSNLRLLRLGTLAPPSLCTKHPCKTTKERYLQALNAELAASFAHGTLHTNRNLNSIIKNAKPLRLFAPYMRYHAPTLYRGVKLPEAMLKDFLKRGSWDARQYSSFSTKEAIAKLFATGGSKNKRAVMLRVTMNNVTPGTPLLWTPNTSTEGEVLFPPGRFTVKAVKPVVGQKHMLIDASFDPNKTAHAVAEPGLRLVQNSHPKPANLPPHATVAPHDAYAFRPPSLPLRPVGPRRR